MNFTKLAAALAASLLLAGSAQAAVLLTTGGASANGVTDYSSAGSVSFDLDLENFSATTLRFVLEDSDLAGPLGLNALVRNLSGTGLHNFNLQLKGIGFRAAGSVTPIFGAVGEVRHTGQLASIAFARPEWAEFHFGNPLGQPGKADWLLDTRGLRAGDTFVITADIPEPSSLALMLSALCMAGLMAARRRG
ncbi:PEP-CTERM sorting domain-containing protein [Massilia sp. Dwa41.01b]|uniref:PEP-CTERM sorting domain-containing protein n=1 Tax=unclassified Massilia TaxID=2609279 RepID=UPI001601D5D4|nr:MULTISPECIES: PEP-CTERM sorting domain-containing protein [unclassified Massilia]QNA88256.1 PEP-CTERM sorting domain-containing protein [Massilia sp. Dwa41.01b]QNA99156.1 PEP-CTERM sorting domain-containing protein [Massilia sp. Se16.2.3]